MRSCQWQAIALNNGAISSGPFTGGLHVLRLRHSLHIGSQALLFGFTENIDQRVKEHSEGKSLHTAKYGPWQLAVYLVVPSKAKALDLERYLKSGSGRAFLRRHIL